MPSFVTMALAPLAVLAAYVIFGISGFGSHADRDYAARAIGVLLTLSGITLVLRSL